MPVGGSEGTIAVAGGSTWQSQVLARMPEQCSQCLPWRRNRGCCGTGKLGLTWCRIDHCGSVTVLPTQYRSVRVEDGKGMEQDGRQSVPTGRRWGASWARSLLFAMGTLGANLHNAASVGDVLDGRGGVWLCRRRCASRQAE